MNERLEKNIETYFLKEVKKLGGMTHKTGQRGFPDRLALFPYGVSYLVELKAKNGKLSPTQKVVHKKLNGIDFHVSILNSKETVDAFMLKAKRHIGTARYKAENEITW